MKFRIGDIVIVNKDKKKDLWQIVRFDSINHEIVRLKGMTNRSIIEVYEDQLIKVDERTAKEISEKNNRNYINFLSEMRGILRNGNSADGLDKTTEAEKTDESVKSKEDDKKSLIFNMPGTILHLDSHKPFMEKCIAAYKQAGIPAVGYSMDAYEFPNKIKALLEKEQPDILVITGHDGFEDNKKPFVMESYINSKYFVEAVREARKFDRNKNSLVIVAGACKSYFEALMNAGANFASSPMRVRISDIDPAIIAMMVSITPALTNIDILKVISYTKSGTDGIGGIETEGTLKKAIPSKVYVPPVDEQPKKDEVAGTSIQNTRDYFNFSLCRNCPYKFKLF